MFNNMKIGVRLIMGFGVVIILNIALIIFSIINLSKLGDNINTLATDRFPKTVWVNNIVAQINESARSLRNAILLKDDPVEKQKQIERAYATNDIIKANLDSLKATIKSEKGKAVLQKFEDIYPKYVDGRKLLFEIEAKGDPKATNEYLFKTFRTTQTEVLAALNAMLDYQTELVAQSANEGTEVYKTSLTVLIVIAVIIILLSMLIAIFISRSITKPTNEVVEAVEAIANGDLSVKLRNESKDEIGKLIGSMKMMMTNIQNLIDESNSLTKSIMDGKLDVRGKSDKFSGCWSDMVVGINNLTDAFVKPINLTAEYVDRISKGDIPPKITDIYKGDFNEIKNNLNQCIDAIALLVADANKLAKAAADGKLDTRADAMRHGGDFRAIIDGVNKTLDNVIGPLNVAAEYVDRISKGDIPPRITDNYNGDFNEIKNNLNLCIDSINALVKDAAMLAKSAEEGKLDTRADASKHGGDFRVIIDGVNKTLDSIIGPLNVAAEYVDRISKGDIPTKIIENYNGDFNEIKNNINQLIDTTTMILKGIDRIVGSIRNGKLDDRANASLFSGDWFKLLEGINHIIDAFVAPLNVTAEYIDRISKGDIPPKITDVYSGDFNEIKNNLNQCIDAVNALVNDAAMLAKAAIDGKLDTRADASKHGGDFRAIVDGVNKTLDNVIGPLNVAAEYVDRVSKGDIPPKITDVYNGDFNEIKNNINQLIESLSSFIDEMQNMSNQHDLGEIDVVIPENKFIGAYLAMAKGVNAMVNSHITATLKAIAFVEELGKGNFAVTIERFPGKKAVLNTSLDSVQGTLITLDKELTTLISAAQDGHLQNRGDASKFQGGWASMVNGINHLLDAIISPIKEAADALEVMATGNLTARMAGEYSGDFERLKGSLNGVGDSLGSLINQVGELASSVAGIASEISSNSEVMASGAQEQSAQADEVATAVEEMSRTVTENAMSASRTAQEAKKNGDIAKEGGKVVDMTVTKMRDIASVVKASADNMVKLGASSQQIGEIISVIDDIADQTNLLALNAAIEAARAGEQGRGFAVVADEVRKLAERTTEATKQIADMIKGIQNETQGAVTAMNKGNEEVTSGIQLADQAGSSLNQIVGSTQELLDMINQIAAASEEQSSTSEEIARNVEAISHVSNDTAKKINEIATAADELNRLTAQLTGELKKFKVDDDSGQGFSTSKTLGKRSTNKLLAERH